MAGSIIGFRGTEEERFWSKVQIMDNGCWIWTAAKTKGYGNFALARKAGQCFNTCIKAHRWAYEFCIGPIPLNLEPDHICRNRGCVNPWHLEMVTGLVNIYRGDSLSAKNAQKIYCKRGHNEWKHFTKKNGRSARRCVVCDKLAQKRRYQPLTPEQRRARALRGWATRRSGWPSSGQFSQR